MPTLPDPREDTAAFIFLTILQYSPKKVGEGPCGNRGIPNHVRVKRCVRSRKLS